MMTPEQILQDLYSDRVKKVIVDGDFAAEFDDQYAFAYAMGSEKMDVLAVCASACYDPPKHDKTEDVMLHSYSEILRIYDALEKPRELLPPALHGARTQITNNENYAPSDSPAARFIIEAAKNSDEIIYILTTGPCTNPVSAYLLDPSIEEKICVVWLGGNCIPEGSVKPFHEWNLHADYAAAQILFNSNVPVLMLPCSPIGSETIIMYRDDLAALHGNSRAVDFFRNVLPANCYKPEQLATNWRKVMCDYAAPAALAVPDALEFSIIHAPVLCDDRKYAADSTRRKILYAVRPNSEKITADAVASIDRLIQG